MLKPLLSAVVALAFVSQGIAPADRPVPDTKVVVENDCVALLAHLEAMTAGDRNGSNYRQTRLSRSC